MTEGAPSSDLASMEPNAARRRLGHQLAGAGIEVGPGEFPFRLLRPGVQVRYVDRLRPEDRHRVLEALGRDPDQAAFDTARIALEPDFVADFNAERLGPVPDGSQDFVIASHVLEHLAEPLGFVDEIHRVLVPGGLALVLLPDRRRTEDRFRAATPLGHLVGEHEQAVVEVSAEHLREFLRDRGRPAARGDEWERQLAQYREHSFHVHCWDPDEFVEVLAWGIEHRGHQWELVDATVHDPPIHYEFGYLLRRGPDELAASARASQFRAEWRAWRAALVAVRPDAFAEHRRRGVPPWFERSMRSAIRRSAVAAGAYRRAKAVVRRIRRVRRRPAR
ncbi:MAG TPA: class I SAM-dependent methyltransferase [Acidimicrobiales bacterium]|nr:class I SAM-dependent methyltransferase [Acidimicrobiales bacterium]